MGASKDRLLRNLSQLEEASPVAHEAAVRAASSRVQAATLIRTAAPAIENALGKDGPSFQDFRRALVESRLSRGPATLEDLAQEAQRTPNNKLVEWVTKGPLQLLGNMADRNGRWDVRFFVAEESGFESEYRSAMVCKGVQASSSWLISSRFSWRQTVQVIIIWFWKEKQWGYEAPAIT